MAMAMPTRSFFFFLIIFCCHPPSVSSYIASLLNRRALHQPLFPPISQPPDYPPSPSPLPKYPSSATPLPFFPFFTSPPPPPSPPAAVDTTPYPSSLPNLPANISSLIFPISSSSSPHSKARKLVLSIALPSLFLALFCLAFAFFLRCRRRHPSAKSSRDEGDHLYAANAAASDGGRKTSNSSGHASAEFLYLGTVVSSRGGVVAVSATAAPPPSDPSYRRLDSPELQPLPPLSRHVRQSVRQPEPCCSSEEEFYSPRVSSAGVENPGGIIGAGGTASCRDVPAMTMDKCGSNSSTLSAPSYPSSNSASSPTRSHSSQSSASTPEESTDGCAAAGPALRLPNPPLHPRTMAPSPPKWRTPRIPSPPSPLQNHSNVFFLHTQPPSRPAPPPPPGFLEPITSVVQPCEPAALISPRTTCMASMAAVHPAVSPMNSDAEFKDSVVAVPRPKLKPLHWDKVRASSDREMVWDQLKSSSFQLNEEMIETLFVWNVTNGAPKEVMRRPVSPLDQEHRIFDTKKSQDIAILLRALNLTKDEVCKALMEGNTDSLDAELLQTLLKMAPSKEEELKLKECRDYSTHKLNPSEKFLKAVLDIPFAFKRVEAMLYIVNFESEINYLGRSFETLQAACEELRNCRMFMKVLEAVLMTGNRMNFGTNHGDACAFKLDTLLKLVDVKGADGKTTLLHFVVQEISRAEASRLAAASQSTSSDRSHACTLKDDFEFRKLGLGVVAGLGSELSNVVKAAAIDSEALIGCASDLSRGISKVNEAIKLNGPHTVHESGRRFHEAMVQFLKPAHEALQRMQSQECTTLSLVKETTEYFHGNLAEETAHPFRIFMIVRDFLSILGQVCKEVGKVNERTLVGSAQHIPLPGTPILPPLFPKFHSNLPDEDDCSLSS